MARARRARAADSGRGRQGADLRAAQPRRLTNNYSGRQQLDDRVDRTLARRRTGAVQRRRKRLKQRRLSARRLHLREISAKPARQTRNSEAMTPES